MRHVTSWVEFFTLLITAGLAAATVTNERVRETWQSLIATPLSGREILRAKMLGTAWKVRWGPFLLFALWLLGLLLGCIHPVGFLAAIALLGAAMWFTITLGTYLSLRSHDSRQASSRTLVPVLLLSVSFLACYMPARFATVFVGMGSVPFVNWLCLVSYGEIRGVMSGDDAFQPLQGLGILTYESPSRVLAVCLLSVAAFAAAAFWFRRAALECFDRMAGRPQRVRESSASGVPSWPQLLLRKRKILAVLAIVVVAATAQIISSLRSAFALREAIAQTDRLFPGWRVDELEAARKRVPEAKNAALLCEQRGPSSSAVVATNWKRAFRGRANLPRNDSKIGTRAATLA